MYFEGIITPISLVREEVTTSWRVNTYMCVIKLVSSNVKGYLHVRGPVESPAWNLIKNSDIYAKCKVYKVSNDRLTLLSSLDSIYFPVYNRDAHEHVESEITNNAISISDF